MGRARGLSDAEKATIVKETGKGSSPRGIATKLGRHIDTIRRYLKNPSPRKQRSDSGVLKSVTARDLRKIRKIVRIKPGQTSKTIFKEAGLPETPIATRNRLLRAMADIKVPANRPPLTTRHKSLRVEWARTYMKQDMQHVIFSDETRATLDGPDGWAKGWVLTGDQRHQRVRRQQGGGGVMIWAGIVDNEIIGPVKVPEGVKITSATYCEMLKAVLLPWLEDIPLSRRLKLVFMQDNAPSHSAKLTKACLTSMGFRDHRLMNWPPASPDLNPIENLWAILKRTIYADGRQYTSKDELWRAIKTAAKSISPSTIKTLTESTNNRIFDVIKRHGNHIDK